MRIAAASPTLQSGLVADPVAEAVFTGLTAWPKRLPPWLFYDDAGSRLFDRITELDEYYLTLTERGILALHGGEMIALAAAGARLRIAELGAGSAEKTRLLLRAALDQQRSVVYEPIDVSPTALESARARIEREIAGVEVRPRVTDYTRGNGHALDLEPVGNHSTGQDLSWGTQAKGERRLVLYIGSSIGNFEPPDAEKLLRRVRASLMPCDSFLLGVDLVKDERTLLAAYNDREGVTAAFNKNILLRLNRDLAADFDPLTFSHRAVWNAAHSRIEMHLESRVQQRAQIEALGVTVDFAPGETIHTENSYKYRPGQAEALLTRTGFVPVACWTDPREAFAVVLARA